MSKSWELLQHSLHQYYLQDVMLILTSSKCLLPGQRVLWQVLHLLHIAIPTITINPTITMGVTICMVVITETGIITIVDDATIVVAITMEGMATIMDEDIVPSMVDMDTTPAELIISDPVTTEIQPDTIVAEVTTEEAAITVAEVTIVEEATIAAEEATTEEAEEECLVVVAVCLAEAEEVADKFAVPSDTMRKRRVPLPNSRGRAFRFRQRSHYWLS
mgnify:CR=1 FL=1